MDVSVVARQERNADRSRTVILAAAEEAFSDRGFAGASLSEIAVAAGVSRGTPSYFFGSKEDLYRAVLERLFAEREAATREAFGSLRRWAQGGDGSLRAALTSAVNGYVGFLLERPAFVRLVHREHLDGAARMKAVRRESRAMSDAFTAIREVAGERGLRSFDVAEAVFVCVSLTFSTPQASAFLTSLGWDFSDPGTRRHHTGLVVSLLLCMMGDGDVS